MTIQTADEAAPRRQHQKKCAEQSSYSLTFSCFTVHHIRIYINNPDNNCLDFYIFYSANTSALTIQMHTNYLMCFAGAAAAAIHVALSSASGTTIEPTAIFTPHHTKRCILTGFAVSCFSK